MKRVDSKTFWGIAVVAAWSVAMGACAGEVAEAEVGLPSVVGDEDGEPRPEVDVCTWANSGDLLVVGTVKEMRMVHAPFVGSDNATHDKILDTCHGIVSPAFAMDVTVEQKLAGDDGQGTKEMTIYVGQQQCATFNPMPISDGHSGKLSWENKNLRDLGSPLQVNQTIGALVHKVPGLHDDGSATGGDQWSLMGESLFTVDADGHIVFQKQIGYTSGLVPTHKADLTRDELVDALAACDGPSNASDERRAYMRTTWGPDGRNPSYYRAGVCFQPEASQKQECESDEECDPDSTCQNGICR